MNPIRILVADDRPSELEDFLEGLNADDRFEADGCDLSPFEIRERIEGVNYDLLLLDLEWGPPDCPPGKVDSFFGFKILAEMAELIAQRGVKVVVYTIHDAIVAESPVSVRIQESVKKNLVAGHIRKPFDPRTHWALLERLVHRPEEHNENQD